MTQLKRAGMVVVLLVLTQSLAIGLGGGGESGRTDSWHIGRSLFSRHRDEILGRQMAGGRDCVGQINSTRTSDTTTLMGPSITASYRLRDDELFHRVGVNFTWLEAGGFDFSPFGNNPNGIGFPYRIAHQRQVVIILSWGRWPYGGALESSAGITICNSDSAAIS